MRFSLCLFSPPLSLVRSSPSWAGRLMMLILAESARERRDVEECQSVTSSVTWANNRRSRGEKTKEKNRETQGESDQDTGSEFGSTQGDGVSALLHVIMYVGVSALLHVIMLFGHLEVSVRAFTS